MRTLIKIEDKAIEFAMNKSVHSDFLIHWTGNDIDKDYDQDWWRSNKSGSNKTIVEPYLRRLKYTLKYGLWMNQEKDFVEFNGKKIKIPSVARACFTELRLSEARKHAQKFGRLGIGFKRFFVFNRMGLPMVYFRPEKENWMLPPLLSGRPNKKINKFWACFLKSMHEEEPISGRLLSYKQFDEFEWRIIYSKGVENRLKRIGRSNICKFFKKPNEILDVEFQNYIKEHDKNKKLKFLVPIEDSESLKTSQWLALIIYPNLAVKVAAEADKDIREELQRLKNIASLKKMSELNSSAEYEWYSKPIEIDLDACRNF